VGERQRLQLGLAGSCPTADGGAAAPGSQRAEAAGSSGRASQAQASSQQGRSAQPAGAQRVGAQRAGLASSQQPAGARRAAVTPCAIAC